MKLIQFIVRLGIPIAAFMALGVGVNELAQHPQPLVAFGLFWLLELFYVPTRVSPRNNQRGCS